MKVNPKKVSLFKSKSVISQRHNNPIEIPKDAPDAINLFIKEDNKKASIKKKKLKR